MKNAADVSRDSTLDTKEQLGFDGVLRNALHAQSMIRSRSALVHDVKSASQAIYWAVDLLKKTVSLSEIDPALKEKQEKYLGWCRQELDNLQKTVQKVLADLTQADSAVGAVDVSALLLDLGKLISDEAALLEVDLQLNVPKDLMTPGSRAQLRQALLGLLFNALDSMPEGGKLTVELLPASGDTQGMHQIVLSDTRSGSGPQANGPSFELDLAADPVSNGIALRVARSIVREHGGDILIESGETPGARIRITLPG